MTTEDQLLLSSIGRDPSQFALGEPVTLTKTQPTMSPGAMITPTGETTNKISTAKAFGIGARRSVLPTIGGLAGGIAVPALAGTLVGGPIGTLAGVGLGIAGAIGGSVAAEKLQEEVPSIAPWQPTPEELAQASAEHPYATLAGELAPQAATLKPSLTPIRQSIQGIRNAQRAGTSLIEGLSTIHPNEAGALINTGIGVSLPTAQVGYDLIAGHEVDPVSALMQIGAGAILTQPRGFMSKVGMHPTLEGIQESEAPFRPIAERVEAPVKDVKVPEQQTELPFGFSSKEAQAYGIEPGAEFSQEVPVGKAAEPADYFTPEELKLRETLLKKAPRGASHFIPSKEQWGDKWAKFTSDVRGAITADPDEKLPTAGQFEFVHPSEGKSKITLNPEKKFAGTDVHEALHGYFKQLSISESPVDNQLANQFSEHIVKQPEYQKWKAAYEAQYNREATPEEFLAREASSYLSNRRLFGEVNDTYYKEDVAASKRVSKGQASNEDYYRVFSNRFLSSKPFEAMTFKGAPRPVVLTGASKDTEGKEIPKTEEVAPIEQPIVATEQPETPFPAEELRSAFEAEQKAKAAQEDAEIKQRIMNLGSEQKQAEGWAKIKKNIEGNEYAKARSQMFAESAPDEFTSNKPTEENPSLASSDAEQRTIIEQATKDFHNAPKGSTQERAALQRIMDAKLGEYSAKQNRSLTSAELSEEAPLQNRWSKEKADENETVRQARQIYKDGQNIMALMKAQGPTQELWDQYNAKGYKFRGLIRNNLLGGRILPEGYDLPLKWPSINKEAGGQHRDLLAKKPTTDLIPRPYAEQEVPEWYGPEESMAPYSAKLPKLEGVPTSIEELLARVRSEGRSFTQDEIDFMRNEFATQSPVKSKEVSSALPVGSQEMKLQVAAPASEKSPKKVLPELNQVEPTGENYAKVRQEAVAPKMSPDDQMRMDIAQLAKGNKNELLLKRSEQDLYSDDVLDFLSENFRATGDENYLIYKRKEGVDYGKVLQKEFSEEAPLSNKRDFSSKSLQQLLTYPPHKEASVDETMRFLLKGKGKAESDVIQKALEPHINERLSYAKMYDLIEQETPEVNRVDYGMEGKVSEAKKEYDRMTHEWYDNIKGEDKVKLEQIEWVLRDGHKALANNKIKELSPEIRDKAKQYVELGYKAYQEKNADTSPRATSFYNNISAFNADESMPEWTTSKMGKNVQRVDVVMPQKTNKGETVVTTQKGNKIKWRGDITEPAFWQPDNLHEQLPNTPIWNMIQYKTGPKGEKIAAIIENQGSWIQAKHAYEKAIREGKSEQEAYQASVKAGSGRGYRPNQDHPLLDHAQRLGMKAAIEQARKEGATHIFVSDAETAMMTEMHDIRVTKRVETEQAAIKELERLQNIYNTDFKYTPDYEKGGFNIYAKDSIDAATLHAKEGFKVDQEEGMRANYGPTFINKEGKEVQSFLPRIAEELTGQKGERVSLGAHKNAFEGVSSVDSDAHLVPNNPFLRKNLIFKNADGTPKTDVSGMMYDIRNVSKEPWTLYSKEHSEEAPLQNKWPSPFRSMTDTLRATGEEPKRYMADKFDEVLTEAQKNYGRFGNASLAAIKTLNRKEQAHLDSVMSEMRRTHTDLTGQLSQKEKVVYGKLRELLIAKQREQIDKNEGVVDFNDDGRPFIRTAKIDEYYVPHVPRIEVIKEILNSPNSKKGQKLKQDFLDYQMSMKPDLTQEGAQELFDRYRNYFNPSKQKKSTDTHFAADRMAEGVGLPDSWREMNLEMAMSRYWKRVSMDRAYHDAIELDPEASTLLGVKKNMWGTEYSPERFSSSDVLVDETTKSILEHIRGERTPEEHTATAAASLATRLFLGPLTNIHIALSTPFSYAKYLPVGKTPGYFAHLAANTGKGITKSLERGYRQLTPNRRDNFLRKDATVAERLQALGDEVSNLTGREATEKWSKALSSVAADYVVNLHDVAAQSGNKKSLEFLKTLDSSYKPGKSNLDDLATRLSALEHGAFDPRTMPKWMLNEGFVAPFFKLNSWNMGQMNNFNKFVLPRLKKGDPEPFLMNLFGGLLGGSIIKELRERLSDREAPHPSMKELTKNWSELPDAKLTAYNAVAAASFAGVAGMWSVGAKAIFDLAYKNRPQGAAFPLDELITDTALRTSHVVQALMNHENPVEIAPRAVADFAKANVQAYRVVLNNLTRSHLLEEIAPGSAFTENEQKAAELSKAGRDLRVWKMAKGTPYQEQGFTEANPYMKIPEKQYKTGSVENAASMLSQMIERAWARSGGDLEAFKGQLRSLKANQYPTMPDPETMPMIFARYVKDLQEIKGPEEAGRMMSDYFQRRTQNKIKSEMVPTL